jgi:hypothetical protein
MLWTSQVVQGLVARDYHLLSSSLTIECLVRGLNASKSTPSAPFFKPSLTSTYVIREFVKLKVEPSPTLKLVTQVVMGVAPQWSGLGP